MGIVSYIISKLISRKKVYCQNYNGHFKTLLKVPFFRKFNGAQKNMPNHFFKVFSRLRIFFQEQENFSQGTTFVQFL